MSKQILTQKTLRELLDYDPETGIFVWKKRGRRWFGSDRAWKIWNTRFPGAKAGSHHSTQRIYINIKKKHYMAHRLAWLYAYGEWPQHEIDHINGCSTDNRLSNLRDVPHNINQHNQRSSHKGSSSRHLGVGWHGGKQKWRAFIKADKYVHLGYFDVEIEAAQAYMAAKRLLHEGHVESPG